MPDDSAGIRIEPFAGSADTPAGLHALDTIFFASSATQSFASPQARAAFRERWLGRYLAHWPELAFVATDAAGMPVGYVVGALADPARDARFADMAFYADFAAASAMHPAHLHINLAPHVRGHGLGGRLVEAFADLARRRGSPGLHVVTGAAARNRRFYERLGFAQSARTDWNGSPIVLLARRL